jgi:hypothetical protein
LAVYDKARGSCCPDGFVVTVGVPRSFLLTNYKQFINYTIMEPKTMTTLILLMRSVSDQLQETCAGSSLGFRRKENEYDAAQDEKGGLGVWLN